MCSLIRRRAAQCTIVLRTQLTDIQRFLYTRNEVPQSGLVDIYAAIDVVRCAMQSPLLEMHSWDGIAKGVVVLSVAMQQRGYGRLCEYYLLVVL